MGMWEAFRHEASTTGQLNHPGIVRLLHVERIDEELAYMVYEYVAGKTLFDHLSQHTCQLEQTVEWIATIAETLEYVHQRGVVHRDISPRNIMIDESNRARLLDFGLSQVDGSFHRSDENLLLGTIPFMSPEQAEARPTEATPYSDLFSLGSVLYYALTSKMPFLGDTRDDVLKRIASPTCVPHSPRIHNPAISKELESVIQKVLSKEPLSRYSTGGDLARALRQAIRPREIAKRQPSPKSSPRRLVQVASIGAIVLGASLIYLHFRVSPCQLLQISVKKETEPPTLIFTSNGTNPNFTSPTSNQINAPGEGLFFDWSATAPFPFKPKACILIVSGTGESKAIDCGEVATYRSVNSKELFAGLNLVLLCISTHTIADKNWQGLPAPFESVPATSDFKPCATTFNAEAIEAALTSANIQLRDTPRAQLTLDIQEAFKSKLRDLGIRSYFGMAFRKLESPVP